MKTHYAYGSCKTKTLKTRVFAEVTCLKCRKRLLGLKGDILPEKLRKEWEEMKMDNDDSDWSSKISRMLKNS